MENISEECNILRLAIKFHKEIEINIKAIKTSRYYVTLDHKTSHKGIFLLLLRCFTSSESWINKSSIDVWFVRIAKI